MLERQRAGIARAKTEGKFKGRKPTARAKSAAIMQLNGQGGAAAEIAAPLGDQPSVCVPRPRGCER